MKYWAEATTALGWLIGWVLVTTGIAELTTRWVYPLSAGLLVLGLVGYRLIAHILLDGLYTLITEGDDGESDAGRGA